MIGLQTLQMFCNKDTSRKGMCVPFSVGDYTCALDGYVMLRVPRIVEVPENPDAPQIEWTPTHAICGTFFREPAEWVPVPTGVEDSAPCKACNGTGKSLQCPECEGKGEVEMETDFHAYDHECSTCDGNGQITEEKFKALQGSHKWLKDEHIVCGQCANGRVWPTTGEMVGQAKINHRFLALIGKLPNAQLGTFGPMEMVRFRFDGGDGVVMPMRQA